MPHIEAIERSIIILRNDAIERGLTDLAITLGWSAIRLRGERLEQLINSPPSTQPWVLGEYRD